MKLGHSEVLTTIFGRWPSFHDAEVIAVRLDRGTSEGSPPSLELDVHLWEMTSEVDPDGFYSRKHHTLATLRFEDIDELNLDGFNRQNVIFDLTIEEGGPNRLVVDLATSYGLSTSFACARGSVVCAKPFVPN